MCNMTQAVLTIMATQVVPKSFWGQVDPNFLTVMADHEFWGVPLSCHPDGKLLPRHTR